MIALPYLEGVTPFPPVEQALDEPNGLLAFGADLSPSRLLLAYSKGIFPWFSEGDPLLWWSPDPRAIIELDGFIASKSLRKLVRQNKYRVTLNTNFDEIIEACASIPRKSLNGGAVSNETWITSDMVNAYKQLHAVGLAHSVEVWEGETVVGGLYGVGIGRVFCGESMFHKRNNTSKLAMYYLIEHMRSHNMAFVDCQMPTEHLESLGAITLTRRKFIEKLESNNHTLDSSGNLTPDYVGRWQATTLTP